MQGFRHVSTHLFMGRQQTLNNISEIFQNNHAGNYRKNNEHWRMWHDAAVLQYTSAKNPHLINSPVCIQKMKMIYAEDENMEKIFTIKTQLRQMSSVFRSCDNIHNDKQLGGLYSNLLCQHICEISQVYPSFITGVSQFHHRCITGVWGWKRMKMKPLRIVDNFTFIPLWILWLLYKVLFIFQKTLTKDAKKNNNNTAK